MSKLAVFLALLSLTGCVEIRTENTYQKGSNETRRSDMDQCDVAAQSKAPIAMDSFDIDRNFELRMRLFDACMEEKGYSIQ